MNKLIGLTGLARSGKDTAARLITHEVIGPNHSPELWQRTAFADPLKTAAEILFDLPPEYAFKDENKTKPMPGWDDLTLREALQKLGTEAMRNTFRDDFWINRWKLEADWYFKSGVGVVVSDVRFDNEARAIRELGGIVIEIRRPGAGLKGDAGQHSSEKGLNTVPDFIVDNHGTIEDLGVKLNAILETQPW